MVVDLIFSSIAGRSFSYLVPEDMESQIKIGMRLLVPFGTRPSVGFVVKINPDSQNKDFKKIYDIIDEEPIFTKELWDLSKWISDYYYCDLGTVLRSCFPKESRIKSNRVIIWNNHISMNEALGKIKVKTKNKMKVLQTIYFNKEILINKLQKLSGIKNINNIISEFRKAEIIFEEEKLHGAKSKFEKIVYLNDELRDPITLKYKMYEIEHKSKKQFELFLYMLSQKHFVEKPITPIEIIKNKKGSQSVINSLIEKQILIATKREVIRRSDLGFKEAKQNIVLNERQEIAVNQIVTGIENKKYSPFLLLGVTGSGKTQVYIESIKKAIEQGKDAIVLVPEISLTPQLVARFHQHFGDMVTIIHSKMSDGERYDSWRLILEGKYKIVIGARSAIFSPLKNLGIIIVDEEHEPSYKQFDMSPRYNARDTAVMRAIYSKSALVLGSATPSIESFHNAQSNKFTLLELPERVEEAQMPEIEIIDLKKEVKSKNEISSLSEILKTKIQDRLDKKEGIILLQNHRGFSTYSKCLACGYFEICENCNVTLTYHKNQNHLRCHFCGFVKKTSDRCPKCYSDKIKNGGIGTQKVEEEIIANFPNAKILRMDMDTTSKRGSHTKILTQFKEGKADILLGTQMVAKGLDFSRVTLVGVILADTGMHLPDFRSNERTFQLLTQVAGRAGRSSLKGEVVIQTYNPDHYCFSYIKAQDYKDFYDYELRERKNLIYPPFGRIILIEFKGEDEKKIIETANNFFGFLNKNLISLTKKYAKTFCQILGPNAAAISKIKNHYRYQIIIKIDKSLDPSLNHSKGILNYAIQQFEKTPKPKDIKYFIDVDPQSML